MLEDIAMYQPQPHLPTSSTSQAETDMHQKPLSATLLVDRSCNFAVASDHNHRHSSRDV
jgi:hypothetical protein